MREVQGNYIKKVNGKRTLHPFSRGLFHCWASQSTEYENGGVMDTVAIVELPDGEIVTVYPNHLKFITGTLRQTQDMLTNLKEKGII